jgi:hypothetical protein
MELDEPGFELKGWVLDHTEDRKLDENDRWAGGVSFPPPHPAPFIVEQMRIEADTDLRFWKRGSRTCAMESQVWGYYDEAKRGQNSNPNRGSRLQACPDFAVSMLGELQRELIIQVRIERRRRYQPYESSGKDDEDRKTRTKLYLFGRDGKFRTAE